MNWGRLVDVVWGVIPLYVGILVGYLSVKKWGVLTKGDYPGLNNLNAYFALPAFCFVSVATSDLTKLDNTFIISDTVGKIVVMIFLALYVRSLPEKYSFASRFQWFTTSFIVATVSASLVIGFPLAEAMYGRDALPLMAQMVVVKAVVWFPLVHTLCQMCQIFRQKEAQNKLPPQPGTEMKPSCPCPSSPSFSQSHVEDMARPSADHTSWNPDPLCQYNGDQAHVVVSTARPSWEAEVVFLKADSDDATSVTVPVNSAVASAVPARPPPPPPPAAATARSPHEFGQSDKAVDDSQFRVVVSSRDIIMGQTQTVTRKSSGSGDEQSSTSRDPKASGKVGLEWEKAPTLDARMVVRLIAMSFLKQRLLFAGLLGVAYSVLSAKYGFEMPTVLQKSTAILSNMCLGLSMVCLGLFMGSQVSLIPIGWWTTTWTFALRFLWGPLAVAIISYIFGCRGLTLKLGVVHNALPQAVVSFVFASQFNVDPDILSTGVCFGTLLSMPLLIIYYIIMELLF